MPADFWASYVSGAAGILIGNPLDVIKVRLQNGEAAVPRTVTQGARYSTLIRGEKGATAPILGYGALNALLFVSYNRTLMLLDPSVTNPAEVPFTDLSKIWLAGAAGGLATWIVSAPTEVVKCRTQLGTEAKGSWLVAKDIWRHCGVRGFYLGGGVTSIRDSVGYGFYFWAYELSKRHFHFQDGEQQAALKVLLCGGLAGVITWASIFPLDVIKTRIQAHSNLLMPGESRSLLAPNQILTSNLERQPGAIEIAKQAYREGGIRVFFRGLGVCSVRAFIVNAVQWSIYEWLMQALQSPKP